MADTTLKFKRGQESKVNSLAKEDGSVIFGLGSSGAPSTLHFDSTNGSSVQRLGVAVASASSANTASTATKLRTARKINDASFDGTKDVDITELHPVVITDQSVDLNTLRLTSDFLGRKLYICGTNGGSANITHKPETANEGFILLVEQLRWYNGSTDYVNKQTLEYGTSHKVYIRYSNGATWGNWVLQSDDGIASTANYAKNSAALGGSSLSQILNSAGSGSAFVGLDTTTNNVVRLTRANGGTVQKTINNVANATSASIANTARLASTAIYSSYNLPYQVGSQFYVTNDTHVMKYGYLKCDGSYQNITLLVTSAFWGNQHGSAYLINFQQDTNSDSSGYIRFTAQAIKIGGNAIREYYAYADQINKRLYLYGKVTGGNSYGKWNVTVLQSSSGYDDWVSDFVYNQNLPSGYSTISQIYPGTAQNSNALGGSSLSQVLNASGSGNAFTGLSGSGSSTLRFTRANGGTVNFIVNNVSHATSASIATTANIAKALPATVTLGSGNGAIIDQNGSNYRQRIRIEDNGSANDNVFVFQQSANAGSTYTDLFRILDNGTVVANTFTGALNGTANYAKNAAALGGSSLSQILASAGGGKYVPLSGGTMTGTLGFTNNTGIVGTMASSDQWRIIGGGSSDSGYLEIATKDNANEPIYVRQYTSFSSTGLKRTATLLDGSGNTSFPGQVSASTLASSVIKGPGETTYQMNSPNLYQIIDLTSSTYSTARWYPVVGSGLNYYGYTHIKCTVQLNSGSKPDWSTHTAGFTCNLDVLVKAGGWGTTDGSDIIRDYSYQFTSENPLSWKQLTNSSRPCIYMRGGGKYRLFSSNPLTWTIITQATTYSSQMVQPESSCPSIVPRRATVYANINGTASSASNASALGGSSLSQILSQSGNGNAFISLDTATNNVIRLTRANGGTVQKTIDNVSHATSANNSDKLDGYNENSFLRYRVSSGTNFDNTLWNQIGIKEYGAAYPDSLTDGKYNYGEVISLPSRNARFDLWVNHLSSSGATNGIQYRSGWGNDKKSWRMILDSVNYISYAADKTAFTGLDTTTNNVIKLTRANGGTVQKTINNVSNATSASIASTSNVSKKVGNSTVGSTSIPVYIKEGTPTNVTSIPSSFAATSVNINDKNLNDIRTPGEYYAGGGNSCSNKPTSVDAFALEVRRAADGWYVQIMYASNNQNKTYIRYYNGSAWTAWTAQSTSGGNNAYNSVSVSNATLKFGRLNGATGTTVTINNVANATSAANANLLDGIDSSRFIYGSGAHGVNSSFSNASSIWKSGFYDLSTTGGSASGLPTTTSWHWLIHAGHRSNTTTYRYGLQIAAPNNTSGNLYYRINPQSGNGTWHTLLDEHNLATYTTKFVTKDELGSGSTTGTINVDAARRIVNSTVNTRNAQSFRVGTPGSGSWVGFPSSYLYSASSTAALKTNAYYRKQVGVLHVAAGTAYHDLVFADAGTDNGIVRVSSKGDTGLIIDTTNYATYSTRYNALSSSTLTVTTAGGVNIDGGSY